MAIDKEYFRQNQVASSSVMRAAMERIKLSAETARAEELAESSKAEAANGSEIAPSESGPSITVGDKGFPARADSGLVPPDLKLDESQREAVELLANEESGCLIGAAGTGKTTIMRFLVDRLVYEKQVITHANQIAFVSFTGTAAHVMANAMPAWLRGRCKTIHSLLEYSPVEEIGFDENGKERVRRVFRPRRTAYNKLAEKIIFIDESSMVNDRLYAEMTEAMRLGTRVYAIGDLNQLPPFGGASAFGFMLAEKPVGELRTIHRQSDPKAQAIIECAHDILNGRQPDLPADDFERFTSGDWATWGFQIDQNPDKAAVQIMRLLMNLKNMRTPDGEALYEPHRDRVMTPGNGFDLTAGYASIQQAPLNAELAPHFDPPDSDHPMIVIDAGASRKEFAVGFRVMATKNEPPDTPNRVTNGMLGRIVEIEQQLAYEGDLGLVGPKELVSVEKRRRVKNLFNREESPDDSPHGVPSGGFSFGGMDSVRLAINGAGTAGMKQESNERFAGPASHRVVIDFENGVRREFRTQGQVDSLALAYVTTVAKAQGAQHPTAIVILHHAVRFQLCRELLYTAVTRAMRRVILLYTPFALNIALSKQRIRGATLAEKIERYRQFMLNQKDT